MDKIWHIFLVLTMVWIMIQDWRRGIIPNGCIAALLILAFIKGFIWYQGVLAIGFFIIFIILDTVSRIISQSIGLIERCYKWLFHRCVEKGPPKAQDHQKNQESQEVSQGENKKADREEKLLGGGDVKLLGVCTLFFTPLYVGWFLMLSGILGLILVILLGRKSVPFGVAVAVAFLLTWFLYV